MVATRSKRAADEGDQATVQSDAKRIKRARTPQQSSSPGTASQSVGPTSGPAAQRTTASVPMKGSRGAAYLAATGNALPSPGPSSGPRQTGTKFSPAKAARLAAEQAQAKASLPRSVGAKRNPLLRQELPAKLAALLDMFGGLQTVHEMMRKRGQRTTFQNMRAAVEEASGRRFLLPHVAQLKHLLPEALQLEWVRLPVAAHSSRTEPHLLISLDSSAAAEAAEACSAVPSGGGSAGDLTSARHLLHCRLAGHLLDSYRGHLDARIAELQEGGDEAGAAQLAAAAAAAADPPISRFLPPYPEGAAEVPQQLLPARPDAPTPGSRAASPSVLAGTAAQAQAGLPLTPASCVPMASVPATDRKGRPPVHPGTVDRHRQRRLSFAAAAAADPDPAALAVARGLHTSSRSAVPQSPLDKLNVQVERQAVEQQQAQQACGAAAAAATAAIASVSKAAQLHPQQQALAACLDDEDLHFGGSIPAEAEEARQLEPAVPGAAAQAAAAAVGDDDEQDRLLASMPEGLRRFSTDGIISFDTLRKLDAADQQHRRLSSKEAVEAREVSAALGQLPRTFTLLQRIFGFQGPTAMKLREVVLRIKQGGAETTSEAQIEAQLRALVQHAPEFLSLKPWGTCGTPALWVTRGANANTIMQRLRSVAAARRDSMGGSTASGSGGLACA